MAIKGKFETLAIEDRKKFDIIVAELLSRGKQDEVNQLVAAIKTSGNRPFVTDKNGYFIRRDGRQFVPNSPGQLGFLLSNAHFLAAFAGRGCISANTLVSSIPIAEQTTPIVSTYGGNFSTSLAFLKGVDDLYRLRTIAGNSVEATLQHRVLTPIGWKHLNQLRSGSLLVSDGILSVHSENKTKLDFWGHYSEDFRLSGELYSLVELAVLDILLQLHKTVCDSSAFDRFYSYLPSIVDFYSQLLFLLVLEYLDESTSSEYSRHLLHKIFQFLCNFLRFGISDLPPYLECVDISCGTFRLDYKKFLELLEPCLSGYLKCSTRLRSLFDFVFFEKNSESSRIRDVFEAVPLENSSSLSSQFSGDILCSPLEFLQSPSLNTQNILLGEKSLSHFDILQSLHRDLSNLFSSSEMPTLGFSLLRLHRYSVVGCGVFRLSDLHTILERFLSQFLPDLLNYYVGDLFSSLPPFSSSNYTTHIDIVDTISHTKRGEYYDLVVPGFCHYEAGGLFHHNSGKTAMGSQKAVKKLSQGQSGAVINPDFENLKISPV